MSTKKVWSHLGKLFKWILWILLLGAILFLIIGYAKFDGGVRDYTRYLNQKDWDEAVAQVEMLDISSYGSLFWSEETGNIMTGTGVVLDTVEELVLDIDVETGEETDIFDPEFADDFESFFAEEDMDTEDTEEEINNDADLDGFGFVNNETGSELSGDVEDEDSEDELSDNKRSLLKIFGR